MNKNSDKEKKLAVSAEVILQMSIQDLQNVLENYKFPVQAMMQRLQQLGYSWKFMNRMQKNLLHFAAEEGDCEAIKMLLDAKVYGVNDFEYEMIDGTPSTHFTALNYACQKDHFEAVKVLVASGANVNIEAGLRAPVILDSIKENGSEMFDYLLECGADINAVDALGFRCLDLAARKGNLVLFDRLLAMGMNPYQKSFGFEFTILHEACSNVANPAVIRRVMALGLNPHEVSSLRWTPIDLLIMNGNREGLSVMMSYGVVDVRAYNRAGETGLHNAISSSNLETAQLLLEAGANPNQSKRFEDIYPIQMAVELANPAMIELLLRFGADKNIYARTGESLLIKATKTKNLAVIECLWRAGVDFNAQTLFSKSFPLHYACTSSDASIIHKMIDCGAVVDATDIDGMTALHRVAPFDKPDVVYALIQRGANANAKDKFLNSPLDYAEHPRIKQILIDAGSKQRTFLAGAYRCIVGCFCCCYEAALNDLK